MCFKVKKKSNGSIKRYKARLMANEFHQQEGLYYIETFSSVVRHTIMHTVLALTTHQRWSIRQLNVQNVFLNEFLNEVYIRQPKGFKDSSFLNHILQLHKSLYGLKQAPSDWFQLFSNYLAELGFI